MRAIRFFIITYILMIFPRYNINTGAAFARQAPETSGLVGIYVPNGQKKWTNEQKVSWFVVKIFTLLLFSCLLSPVNYTWIFGSGSAGVKAIVVNRQDDENQDGKEKAAERQRVGGHPLRHDFHLGLKMYFKSSFTWSWQFIVHFDVCRTHRSSCGTNAASSRRGNS